MTDRNGPNLFALFVLVLVGGIIALGLVGVAGAVWLLK